MCSLTIYLSTQGDVFGGQGQQYDINDMRAELIQERFMSRNIQYCRHAVFPAALAAILTVATGDMTFAEGPSVHQATLAEPNEKTQEVSTEEMRAHIGRRQRYPHRSPKARPTRGGDIAGAKDSRPSPASRRAAFAAAVERLVGGDKSKALVLDRNSDTARRVAQPATSSSPPALPMCTLSSAFRCGALDGLVEIELEGILRFYKIDQTAVFFDARTAADFAKVSLSGTHNVPVNQLATDGLRKAPMPSNDFNTRIVLFGRDFAQARALADAVGKLRSRTSRIFRHIRSLGGGGEDPVNFARRRKRFPSDPCANCSCIPQFDVRFGCAPCKAAFSSGCSSTGATAPAGSNRSSYGR